MGSIVRLISFLVRLSGDIPHSRLRIAVIAVCGVVAGVSSTVMIALINSIVSQPATPTSTKVWAFVGLCVAMPLCRFLSQALLVDLTQSSLLALRLRLSRRVLSAPLRQLEQIGAPGLMATLTNDIATIADSMSMVPLLVLHASVVASCLVYLGWLNPVLLLQVALFIVAGVLTYRFAANRALHYFRRSRQRLDEVFGQIRSMVEGTKELKMHRGRRRDFLQAIEVSTTALQREQKAGQIVFSAASSWGQVLFFILIGVIVLLMPRFQTLESKVLIGYTIVLFQMMAPLEVLLTAIPGLSRGVVAMSTVEHLGFSLEAENPEAELSPATIAPWDRLDLVGVVHSYRQDNSDESFQLGPVDLTFRPGELVFLVGGNGSGKTTLAKILIGLYPPEGGEIRFAGETITDANRDEHRDRFSVVFSDFFLFEHLLGLTSADLDEDALRYLQRLQLDRKVQVQDGRFSTLALSQGQRKRLALLTAYLEDRPIYLFDEWAADQDPTFKQIFYLELLPELRRRGKTVFVISHDDHYFHVADRIVKLDYGQVEFDGNLAEHMGFLALQGGSTGELRAQA